MLPFLILVKINGTVHEIGYRNPEEYKILRLFQEVKDVIVKHKYKYNEDEDKTVISVALPWNETGERKLIAKDSDLYSVFEEFFVNNYPAIEFEVEVKNAIEQNYREWLSKVAPAFLERMDRDEFIAAGMLEKFPMEKKRKDNRGFTIKTSACNGFGNFERRTRTTQGVTINGQEVGSSSGQGGGQSSSNVRQARRMRESGSFNKDQEDSPWACF